MIRALLLPSLALAALSGCRPATPAEPQQEAKAAADLPTMPCALGGSRAFSQDCRVEQIAAGRGWTLVVHHPDGAFRRLTVTTDGRGVVAADGAEPAGVAVIDPQTIEVEIAGDRYRLPATIKGATLPAR